MKKDMIKKHDQEKVDLTKKHEAALATQKEEAKAREEDLNNEIEKYLKSNEDLFDQVDALNNELDDLRNEQIGTLAASNSQATGVNPPAGAANPAGAAELAEEKQKHITTQALLTDYMDQVKAKTAECDKLDARVK